MKKSLFLLFMFMIVSPSSFAFVCLNKYNNTKVPSGGTVKIPIPISSQIQKGENIFGNVGDYIECKNEQPYYYIDYLDLTAGGITPGSKIAQYDSGVYINNNRISSKNNSRTNIFKLSDPSDMSYHPVDIDMFIVVPNKLGQSLIIEQNEPLMTLHLYRYSTPNSSHGYYGTTEYFYWTFVAANRVVLESGTCDINNNEVIYVDFGLVAKSRITNNGLDSISKDIDLQIDCSENNIDVQKIKITLNAESADFNKDAIATNQRGNLGVMMYHDSKVIAPFNGFISNLYNGISNEKITFSLIKNPKVESKDLLDGQFSASGSLIVSLP